MPLSLNYRFLIASGLTSAVVTALLNLLVSQLLWYTYDLIPLLGPRSLSSYLTSASMVSSFAITFVVTKCARTSIRNNTLMPLHWHLKSQTLIDQLPSQTAHRAFILGNIGALMSGLTIWLLHTKGVASFYHHQFAAFSVVYFLLLAGAIAVMSAYRAMGDDVFKESHV